MVSYRPDIGMDDSSEDEESPLPQPHPAAEPVVASVPDRLEIIKNSGKQMEQQHQRLQDSIERGLGNLESKPDTIAVSVDKPVAKLTDRAAKQDLLVDCMVRFLSAAQCQASSQAQMAASFQQSAANSTLIASSLQLLVDLELGRIQVPAARSTTLPSHAPPTIMAPAEEEPPVDDDPPAEEQR